MIPSHGALKDRDQPHFLAERAGRKTAPCEGTWQLVGKQGWICPKGIVFFFLISMYPKGS